MNKGVQFPGFKLKALTLSYDDGVPHDKRLISIMQKYGLKGTFNLNSGWFGQNGRMTKEEVLEVYPSSGMEVAIHGHRHLSLAEVNEELAVDDVLTDRKELEKLFGSVIKGMAYANGSFNDKVVDILKKSGVNYSRTVISTEKFDLPTDWLRLPATCHHGNPRLMELAKEFVEKEEHWYYWNNKLQLFYLWGHSYEFDDNNNWELIEDFAKYVGGREDIWYATNGEIYEYLQAGERLQFSADGSFVRNPSCIDVYINYLEKKSVVPAGKTVKI